MFSPFGMSMAAAAIQAASMPGGEVVYPPGGEGIVTAAADSGIWTGWSADNTLGTTFGSFAGDEPLGGAVLLAVANFQTTQLYVIWEGDVRDRLPGTTITLGGVAFPVADAASITYYAGSPGMTEVAYNSPALVMAAGNPYTITVT
jgi:hypothetical protein